LDQLITPLNIKSYKKFPIIHMKNYNRERNDDKLYLILYHNYEKVQKYFINNKEGESSDDGDSPSFSAITIRI